MKKWGVIIDNGHYNEIKTFVSEREAKSFYDCLLSNFEEAILFEIKEGKQANGK